MKKDLTLKFFHTAKFVVLAAVTIVSQNTFAFAAQLDGITPTSLPVPEISSEMVKEIMSSTVPPEDMAIIDQAYTEKASVADQSINTLPKNLESKAVVITKDIPVSNDTVEISKTTTDKAEPFKDEVALALPPEAIIKTDQEQTRFANDATEPVIVDNDEEVEIKATIQYKELNTDDGKTKVLAGAQFPIVISSQITSKTAKQGDPVEAKLKYDLKIGDRLIAKKGSQVNGHLNYVLRARSTMHSLLSPERWYRNSGCIGVSFDEIVTDKGEHLPLVAKPAQCARIVKNKAEGRVLGVNHEGQVTGPWSQQLRYKAIRIGMDAALGPAGVFSFGAMPVALGVIGACNPSFAFTKPIGLNVRHRRIKGFCWGFLSGIPGSWIIEDTVIKGQEAIIKPGDEFLVEFKEEFTGEPATDASLIAGGRTKVHGQVVPKSTKKKGN